MSDQVNFSRMERNSYKSTQPEQQEVRKRRELLDDQMINTHVPLDRPLTRIEAAKIRKAAEKAKRKKMYDIKSFSIRQYINSWGRETSSPPIMQPKPEATIHVRPWTEEEVEGEIPPRNRLFPSQRIVWTKRFHNLLMILFIGLTITLLWWGLIGSPWGEEQVKIK